MDASEPTAAEPTPLGNQDTQHQHLSPLHSILSAAGVSELNQIALAQNLKSPSNKNGIRKKGREKKTGISKTEHVTQGSRINMTEDGSQTSVNTPFYAVESHGGISECPSSDAAHSDNLAHPDKDFMMDHAVIYNNVLPHHVEYIEGIEVSSVVLPSTVLDTAAYNLNYISRLSGDSLYDRIIEFLIPFSFGPAVHPIVCIVRQRMAEIESTLDTHSTAKLRLKVVNKFCESIGIDPVNRFNEQV